MELHWSNIRWDELILTAFSCTMLVLAIILFLFDWLLHKIRRKEHQGILLRWLLLLPIGVTGIYVFFMQVLFPIESAAVMNWPTSPFQYEVALASLSLGILGLFSFRASYGFRLATVIFAIIWLWGHAIYEVYHIIITSNIYLGHAVTWFWVDVILPFLLIGCIRRTRSATVIDESPSQIQ